MLAFLCAPDRAGAIADPSDSQLRHGIQPLGDAGVLKSRVTTCLIPCVQLEHKLSEIEDEDRDTLSFDGRDRSLVGPVWSARMSFRLGESG